MLIVTNGVITRARKTDDAYGFDDTPWILAQADARIDKKFRRITDANGLDVMSETLIIIKDPDFDILVTDFILIGAYLTPPVGITPKAIKNIVYADGLFSSSHIEVFL